MSIRWLLDAYTQLAGQNKNITLVPVTISYDRIYEQSNLAREMITGKRKNYNFAGTMRQMFFTPENSLGECFVKYLEPIDLENYITKAIGSPTIGQDNFEVAAQRLSRDLLKVQQQNTPTTLNTIISSVLLQENKDTMLMSKLLEKARMLYEYLKLKQLHTYMQVQPNQVLAEKHVDGLGFKMKDAGKKNCIITIKSEDYDLMQTLMLSYYSMPLSGHTIAEGSMALFLKNETNAVDGQFSVAKLQQMVSSFSDLLKNEDDLKNNPGYLNTAKVLERIQFFVDYNCLSLSEDKQHVANMDNDFARTTMDFGEQLVVPLIDTYLVVLKVVDQICGKNLVLNKKTLIRELHAAFKTLYMEDETIPYLSSCIKEVIKTAIERYEEAGFLDAQTFASNNGCSTTYISSPAESADKVISLLQSILTQRNWSKDAITVIELEVENVILRTRGPQHINSNVAKL